MRPLTRSVTSCAFVRFGAHRCRESIVSCRRSGLLGRPVKLFIHKTQLFKRVQSFGQFIHGRRKNHVQARQTSSWILRIMSEQWNRSHLQEEIPAEHKASRNGGLRSWARRREKAAWQQGGVFRQVEELQRNWKYMGTIRTFDGRAHRWFRMQIGRTTAHRRMQREAGTSVRSRLKASLRVLWNADNESWCRPVPVSEDAFRSPWQSVPGGWRGACGGGSGIFFEEVLDCDRCRPQSQHSCRCEAVYRQVTSIPGQARPQDRPAPSREGSCQVYQKLLHWNWSLKPSIMIANTTAPLGATKYNKSSMFNNTVMRNLSDLFFRFYKSKLYGKVGGVLEKQCRPYQHYVPVEEK